MVVREMVIC